MLIGQDPWLPDNNNGFISSQINAELTVAKVSSLMVPNQRSWDLDLIADIFNVRDKELIMQIPLNHRRLMYGIGYMIRVAFTQFAAVISC